jgi:D-threonate/D-erythronate kinase
MPSLKLLADDLTGALDTAAEFVGQFGPLEVFWSQASIPPAQDRFAIDSGTRERPPDEAFDVAAKLAPLLAGADVAYKKIDSLLRGPWVAELDACLRTGQWDACLVAPAFAHQGRRTRAGQHYALHHDGRWSAVGQNIMEQLRERGLEARPGDPAGELARGISVFDAETDADLDRIVRIGRRYPGRLLWCGSGGLAGALARGTDVSAPAILKRPVLGVFGSDHPSTSAQLAACDGIMVGTADIRRDLNRIRHRLDGGIALVKLETPGAVSRAEAAQHFAAEIMHIGQSLDPPGTLLIAGGETLKALCVAVGGGALLVSGRLEPGVPRSVIQGGSWAGVDVISKSGAFGPPDLWSKLLSRNGFEFAKAFSSEVDTGSREENASKQE